MTALLPQASLTRALRSAAAANPVVSLAVGGIGTLAVGLLGLAWLRRNREVADLAPRVAAAAGTPTAAGTPSR